MPRGKTAGELRAEHERIRALADQDLRDLNAGRVPAPQVRLQRMVRRLRWLRLGQVAVFLYALLVFGAIVSLATAERWECWVLIPIPNIAIVLLFHWGRWFPVEFPNVEVCDGGRKTSELEQDASRRSQH